MPELRLDLSETVLDDLRQECELLGFETPEEYVLWVVDNRAALEGEEGRSKLLTAYRERLRELHEEIDRLEAEAETEGEARTTEEGEGEPDTTSESGPSPAADATTADDAASADAASADDVTAAADGGATTRESPAAEAGVGNTRSRASDRSRARNLAENQTSLTGQRHTADSPAEGGSTAESATRRGSTTDERGSDDRGDPAAVQTDAAGSTAENDASSTDAADTASPSADAPGDAAAVDVEAHAEANAEGMQYNLSPATARIADDSVAEAAGVLADVDGDRVDEMARQAVAKTRRQLGDEPDTGIDYESTTALRSGARPGSEIADLDSIEVPGYDDDLLYRRRTAVGAALALLRDVGEARRSTFVEELYDEFPAGYESEGSWWGCVKRGLRQVDRVDGAGDGSRTWRYRDYKGRVRVFREEE